MKHKIKLLSILLLTNCPALFATPLVVTGEAGVPPLFGNREIMAMSLDNAKTWSYLPSVANNNMIYSLEEGVNSLCSDNKTNTLCISAQGSFPYDNINSPYNLSFSIDNGQTWNSRTISGIPAYSGLELNQLNCFKNNDTNTRCVIRGSFKTLSDQFYMGDSANSFLALSKDNGDHWATQRISGLPTDAVHLSLTQGSCTGEGKNAICTYGADVYRGDEAHSYYMITSTNAGDTWVANPINTPTAPAAVSCTGDSTNGVCISTGGDTNIINISKDGGHSWQSKSVIIPHTTDTYLGDIQCLGSGSTTYCTALGQYVTDTRDFVAFSASTKDAGNTWSFARISNDYLYIGNASTLTCAGKDKSAVCAFIYDYDHQLYLSHDAGASWQSSKILGDKVKFSNISCKESTPNTTCIAAGSEQLDKNKEIPVLAISYDAGNTWERKSIQGLPAELSGAFVR